MDDVNKLREKFKNGTFRWCQLTYYRHQRLVEQEFYLRTGSYQWAQVFGGEVKLVKEVEDKLTTDYDVIQINVSGQDYHLVNKVREMLDKAGNKHTKIVANLDYTVELWQQSFDYLYPLKEGLRGADMIFGTEHHMSNAMELITGRKVYITPHPCHVKRLKSQRAERKKPIISIIWHRYDNVAMLPSLIPKDLGYKVRLLGYEDSADRKKFCTATFYDDILGATNYIDFCNQLQESLVVIEPFTLTSHGRSTIDCAALGIPVIGSERVESCRRCFPHTLFDPWDVKKGRELLKKVLTDEEFRKKVINTAQKEVEYYSHKNCADRFFKFLEKGSYKLKPEEI